jgi:hypothetical protein
MTAKLVTLGDSLTQGFQHGAVRRSDWSFPAMLARALGGAPFPVPDFSAGGIGGPLVDLELLLGQLSEACGDELELWEAPRAISIVLKAMGLVEDYWERGAGTAPSLTGPLHHNLGCWGFEVLDAITLSDATCRSAITPPRNNWVVQLPEFGMYRSALRVFNPAQDPQQSQLTQLGLAERIGARSGIENLLVALGANNALGTCVTLDVRHSENADLKRLSHDRNCNLWRPQDFEQAYGRLAAQIADIKAERVFVATVPHVTVPPVTRGVSPQAKRDGTPELVDGHYEYYTRFWTWDEHFNPLFSDKLTRKQASEVDATVDAYNRIIVEEAERRGWHVIDLCMLLDRLAFRRNAGKPPYQLPDGLVAALKANPLTQHRVRPDGTVLLDTRYFRIPAERPSDDASTKTWQEAYCGGIFGLDGIHPTTTGYGIIAYEVLKVFQSAHVPGADPEQLDWRAIVQNDTLLCTPPALLESLEATLDRVFSPLQLLFKLIPKLAGYGAEP